MLNIFGEYFISILMFGSLGTPVSSTNKTNHHDIAEISMKVALNTITLTYIDFMTGH
jgi:L-lactate permease